MFKKFFFILFLNSSFFTKNLFSIEKTIATKKSNNSHCTKKKIPMSALQEIFFEKMTDLILMIENKLFYLFKENKKNEKNFDFIIDIFHWAAQEIKIIKNDPTVYSRKELEEKINTTQEYFFKIKAI